MLCSRVGGNQIAAKGCCEMLTQAKCFPSMPVGALDRGGTWLHTTVGQREVTLVTSPFC